MPTYEYVCDTCEETFEIFQSIKDDALTECPKPDCDGKIKRMISAGAGIIFKGSGFYQTDYRSASYAAGAKADKPASSTSGSSSGGGGDSAKSSTNSSGSSGGSSGSSTSTSSSSSSSGSSGSGKAAP